MTDKPTLFASAEQACNLLKCLANTHRLMLVCHLMDGEKSVGELADLVGISHSNASQHLGQLRLYGILATRREAQTIYYDLVSEPARQVLDVLYQQYCSGQTHGKKSKRVC
jgi:DNA-binding transcriptional ArsR family regulator